MPNKKFLFFPEDQIFTSCLTDRGWSFDEECQNWFLVKSFQTEKEVAAFEKKTKVIFWDLGLLGALDVLDQFYHTVTFSPHTPGDNERFDAMIEREDLRFSYDDSGCQVVYTLRLEFGSSYDDGLAESNSLKVLLFDNGIRGQVGIRRTSK